MSHKFYGDTPWNIIVNSLDRGAGELSKAKMFKGKYEAKLGFTG